MKTMTLGEFRKLTEDMDDDARITIRIDNNGDWIHPNAAYVVNDYDCSYDNNPFESATGITLSYVKSDL